MEVFAPALLVIVLVGVALYFVPAFVATRSRHPYAGAIVVLNVLAGWTFLGWVAALVWAVAQPARSAAAVPAPVPPGYLTPPPFPLWVKLAVAVVAVLILAAAAWTAIVLYVASAPLPPFAQ